MIDLILLALAASEQGDVTLGIPEERRWRQSASTLPDNDEDDLE